MADLASIIARKETNDAEWRAGREAERKNVYALQDTAVSYIVSQPDAYARYLDLQAENPMYSAGNVALSMIQNEGGTMFGTKVSRSSQGAVSGRAPLSRTLMTFLRPPGKRSIRSESPGTAGKWTRL